MVKTRSDFRGVRVTTKAPRKIPGSNSGYSPSGRSSRKYEGGNSVCPRETPIWQKEITKFFPSKLSNDESSSSSETASSSTRDE